MKNKNLTLKQFIKKIKKVDVGELLEKAKGINVEDIKSIKFSDLKAITKSDYFYPSLGIFFASLTSIFFFFPSIEALKNRQSKSSQYKFEKQELPLVDEELQRREDAKINIDTQIKNLVNLVPSKGNLVFLPEILYDSSKRSGAQIVEFAPITVEDINSCRSSSEEDFFNNDFQNDMYSDNFGDDQDFENPMDELPFDDFQSEGDNAKLEIYQFNPDESEINKEFESLKQEISSIFESNYFLINIKSDYISSLNFLKYLQEYKIAILPYCFEPQMTGNTFNNSGTEIQPSFGEIDARIIVNIPNYK